METIHLRIGNLVENRKNQLIIVSTATLHILKTWENTKYEPTPPFKPIPITAERLDKINLDRQGDRDMWVSEDLKMGVSYWTKLDRFEEEGFYLMVKDRNGVMLRTSIKIEYIHQVQNFHLDFTGKQLTIK